VRGYELYLQDGTLGFQMATGAGSAVCGTPGSACTDFLAPPPALGGTILNDDRWHHVAVVVDRCNGIGEMYVDGALEHTFTPRTGDLANDAALFIADSHSIATAPQYFTGCFDELEFFKRALSAAEVASLYDAGWAGKCKPPTGVSIGRVARCVTSLHNRLRLVVATEGKVIRGCVKAAVKSGAAGAGACLTADARGIVARTIAKAAGAEAKDCDGVVTELGPESALAASDAAVEEVLGMTSDVLGAELDNTLAAAATDATGAQCQAAVLGRAQKLLATELKTFESCASLRLEHGSTDPATLTGCADDPTESRSIAAAAQPGGKIAIAAAKLAKTARSSAAASTSRRVSPMPAPVRAHRPSAPASRRASSAASAACSPRVPGWRSIATPSTTASRTRAAARRARPVRRITVAPGTPSRRCGARHLRRGAR
jgi:hypothetical protein